MASTPQYLLLFAFADRDGSSLNPYTPGSGIKPLKLAGRDGDLEAFGVLLECLASGQHERSLIYSGLRGVSSCPAPA